MPSRLRPCWGWVAALTIVSLVLLGSVTSYVRLARSYSDLLEGMEAESTKHLLVLSNELLALHSLAMEGASREYLAPALLSISSEADWLAKYASILYDVTEQEAYLDARKAFTELSDWALAAYNEAYNPSPDKFNSMAYGKLGELGEVAVAVNEILKKYKTLGEAPGEVLAGLASRVEALVEG